ncbi:MAG: ThuA domain-containing protein [Planctomycetota bacterium]
MTPPRPPFLGLALLLGPLALALRAAQPHVLLVTQSCGFTHDVARRAGERCLVEQVFEQMAARAQWFTVECTQDVGSIDEAALARTQVIAFYTTGELPFTEAQYAAFDRWLKNGGAVIGMHCATDTLANHAIYPTMIGGTFDGHPWGADSTVTIRVNDGSHPATRGFAPSFSWQDEIYRFRRFDASAVRVLMSLDMERTALKQPYHVPIAWCKTYGQGRVFYTSLGHRPDVWTSAPYQEHLQGALRWLCGREAGDATPNPDVARKETELAE